MDSLGKVEDRRNENPKGVPFEHCEVVHLDEKSLLAKVYIIKEV